MPPIRNQRTKSKRWSPYGALSGLSAAAKHRAKARPMAPSLQRQVKALVEGKRRQTPLVTRSDALVDSTQSYCLYSGTPSANATASTAQLVGDSDTALINSASIKGYIRNEAKVALNTDAAGSYDPRVRLIFVWFYKPILPPDANGLLPPITEVLTSDSVDAPYVEDTYKAGRFTILSDKTFRLGQNCVLYNAGASGLSRVGGALPTIVDLDYTVQIGKKCNFVDAANSSAANPGGHYQSTVTNGRIDKGLLVMYSMADPAQGVGDVNDLVFSAQTRVDYTM